MFAGAKKHPGHGGNPYSDNFTLDIIMWYQLGLPLVTDELNDLHAVYAYTSIFVAGGSSISTMISGTAMLC
jgi:hypothetical protein